MLNQRFNRLTVIAETDRKWSNSTLYLCRCVCGNEVFTTKYKLLDGHTKSCGCFKRENTSIVKSKHRMTKTPEFKAWCEMRQRCYNAKLKTYHHYGGRGIKVCQRWLDAFQNFIDDMGARPTLKHSLDRIDVNGDYEPANCRWATSLQQNGNRRDTTKYLHKGEERSLTEIARMEGIQQQTLFYRVRRVGLTIEQALTTRKYAYLAPRPRRAASDT